MERTITGMYYNGNIWAVSCWNRNNAVYVHGMTVNTLAACVVKSWTTMIIELSRHHEGPFGEVSVKNAFFNMKSSCYWYVVGCHMTIASNIPRFLLSIAGEVHSGLVLGHIYAAPPDAGTGIFREHSVRSITVDALAPCNAKFPFVVYEILSVPDWCTISDIVKHPVNGVFWVVIHLRVYPIYCYWYM